MSTYDYDIAILGAGPGGYVAAIRASQLGLRTAVIEKEKLGGVCLNIGCIPSKAIIHQAEIYEHALEAADLGLSIDASGFDYAKVFKKSRAAADRLSKGVGFLMKKNNIEVVAGTGRLSSGTSISVTAADGATKEITAANIIIATGSSPRQIPGFEFDEETILSSNGILMQEKLPESLVILGAGAIGCEFAHALSTFGTKVTIVEMLDNILPNEDPDTSAILASSFKKRKIAVHTKTKALKVEKQSKGVTVHLEDSQGKTFTAEGEKLLVVVGRVPNTVGIGLQEIGVKTDRGFVQTGDYYQTAVPTVFAIGDVVPSPLLAHVASAEGELVVEHIAGHETAKKIDPTRIPGAVYTEPQVASFGYSYEDAVKAGHEAVKAVFPYRGAGKAAAIGKTDGQVILTYDKKTKEVLGASIAGAQATELIHELLLARNSELLAGDVAGMIHAHPTLSEAVMEAAKQAYDGAIHV